MNGFLEGGVVFAFGLTLLAGLSTGLGSLAALLTRRTNKAFLCAALGFSAGVMVYVSTIEIYAKARLALTGALGLRAGSWATAGAFFAGILLILLIDRLIPSYENPHEAHGVEEIWACPRAEKKDRDEGLVKMGVIAALAIGIHNFPEGLAVGVAFGAAAMGDSAYSLAGALALAIGIGIQNLPEGLAVAMPLQRTGLSRFKGFMYGQFSGMVEPLAGVLGAFAVVAARPILPYALAFAAGAMIFVVVEDAIPEAQREGNNDVATMGAMLGFALMMTLDVALG